jgi:tetratricopeptide (TPR) repeat protein
MAASDNGGTPVAPTPAPQVPAAPLRQPRGLRKWLYRLAALTFVPTAFFAVLELSLRASGYGQSTDFFVDGADLERVGVWIDNPLFGRWVFPRHLEAVPQPLPFALAKAKPPGTYRIFVLGESAALGFPDSSTSFARVLEMLLRTRYPRTQFEVVNASMVAINSHVVLPIARQCVRCEPDLFVVHLGNNEVVGPFGAAGVLGPFSPNRRVIQANLAVKTMRTGQMLNRLVGGFASAPAAPQVWDGMAMFVDSQVRADNERLPRIYGHFRENLEDICAAGNAAGAQVILCTIPVNLRDSPPFGSLHAADLSTERQSTWETHFKAGVRCERAGRFAEALSEYTQAAALDADYAELAFRRGRCAEALGKSSGAAEFYRQARDLDTLRFRSDTTINETIRAVAGVQNIASVRLADAERAFDAGSSAGVPGEELFLEHVHMTFKGNYLLARTVFQTIAELGPAALEPAGDTSAVLSEEECARRLGQTEWTRWKFAKEMYDKLLDGPPFTTQFDHRERLSRWHEKVTAMHGRLKAGGIEKAIADCGKAAEGNGSDWMIRMQLGDLLSEAGRPRDALKQYQQAMAQLRHNPVAHRNAGTVQLKLGNAAAAERHFRDALRLVPDDVESNIGLAEALEGQGKNDAARAIYEEQLRRSPRRAYAPEALGRFLYRTGDLDGARVQLTEALRREPRRVAVHVDLGMTALKQERVDEAIEHFEAALALQPDWPELRRHLAEIRKGRP